MPGFHLLASVLTLLGRCCTASPDCTSCTLRPAGSDISPEYSGSMNTAMVSLLIPAAASPDGPLTACGVG